MKINVEELNKFIWRESFACKYKEVDGIFEHTKEECPRCNHVLLQNIANQYIQDLYNSEDSHGQE